MDGHFALRVIPSPEDVLAHLVQAVRGAARGPTRSPTYRGAIFLRSIICKLIEREQAQEIAAWKAGRTGASPELDWDAAVVPFLEAAFELVRRGILVPERRQGPHVGESYLDWDTFLLTTGGQEWAARDSSPAALPAQRDRFLKLLLQHEGRFGPVYARRCREALDAYRYVLYLSCLTMAGAAVESIQMRIALEKAGGEEKLEALGIRSTRRKLNEFLSASMRHEAKRLLDLYSDPVKYWRDDAAHANEAELDEVHAFTSLHALLQLADFVDARWSDLLGPSTPG